MQNSNLNTQNVVQAVMAQAGGNRSLAEAVRKMACDIATIEAAADSATAVRRECLTLADNFICKGKGAALSEADQVRYRKSVINAIAYATSELAACYGESARLVWNSAKKQYYS